MEMSMGRWKKKKKKEKQLDSICWLTKQTIVPIKVFPLHSQ